ncbi:MAG: hypothetical protein ACLSB9_26305 [Hydrogeniiclostridium mannosilyticum]
MKESKLEKQKKNLLKIGVMEESDTLIDFFQVGYVERLVGRWGQWKKGWAYFTEERLIVITGLLEENIVIPYQKIQALEKCAQGITPIGIAVTYENMAGEIVTDKLSMMKREQWMSFMAERGKAN